MTPVKEQSRFVDQGALLAGFAEKVFAVCPNCKGPVLVTSGSKYGIPYTPKDSRAVCLRCSYQRVQAKGEPLGFAKAVGIGRCANCGFKFPTQRLGIVHVLRADEIFATVDCPLCGQSTELLTKLWGTVITSLPLDPQFGLPLWLQMPCCGGTFWAYNGEHLEKLRQYVSAILRERVVNHHRSTFQRLPKWMTAAKNRDTVLACITKLEAKLESINA
jgi:hypothetical protein